MSKTLMKWFGPTIMFAGSAHVERFKESEAYKKMKERGEVE